MDDLFAQYCMLIITAFTVLFFFFFCFHLGWGRPLCVYWGEGLKIIIPNFLMYCFFFFFFASTYTILSSDLRPPFGPMASWRLKVFCTMWWMLIGVFITQSWMSFLVCSFLSLIPSSFRHHHVFSKVRKHSVLVFFKKGPKCCTLHMKALSHRREALPEREWMTEKKKKRDRHSRNKQIHSTEQYWRWERGFRFPFFFFWRLSSLSINATSFDQHKETGSTPQHPSPPTNKSPDSWTAAVAAEGSPWWPSCSGPPASLSKFAESGGGTEFKHQLRPAWWH